MSEYYIVTQRFPNGKTKAAVRGTAIAGFWMNEPPNNLTLFCVGVDGNEVNIADRALIQDALRALQAAGWPVQEIGGPE